jgi:hypothetical protein
MDGRNFILVLILILLPVAGNTYGNRTNVQGKRKPINKKNTKADKTKKPGLKQAKPKKKNKPNEPSTQIVTRRMAKLRAASEAQKFDLLPMPTEMINTKAQRKRKPVYKEDIKAGKTKEPVYEQTEPKNPITQIVPMDMDKRRIEAEAASEAQKFDLLPMLTGMANTKARGKKPVYEEDIKAGKTEPVYEHAEPKNPITQIVPMNMDKRRIEAEAASEAQKFDLLHVPTKENLKKFITYHLYLHRSITAKGLDAAIVFSKLQGNNGANNNFEKKFIAIIMRNGDVFVSCNEIEMTKNLGQLIGEAKYSMHSMKVSDGIISKIGKIKNDNMIKMWAILCQHRYYKLILNIFNLRHLNAQENTTIDTLSLNYSSKLDLKNGQNLIWERVRSVSNRLYFIGKELLKKIHPLVMSAIITYAKGFLYKILNPNGPIFSIAGKSIDQILSSIEALNNPVGEFVKKYIRESKFGRELFLLTVTDVLGEFTNKHWDNLFEDQIEDDLKDPGKAKKIVNSAKDSFTSGFSLSDISIFKPEFVNFIYGITDIAQSAIVGDNTTDRFLDKNNPEYNKSISTIARHNVSKWVGEIPLIGGYLQDKLEDYGMALKEAANREIARKRDYDDAIKGLNIYKTKKRLPQDDPTLIILELTKSIVGLRLKSVEYELILIKSKNAENGIGPVTKKEAQNGLEKARKEIDNNQKEIIKIISENIMGW